MNHTDYNKIYKENVKKVALQQLQQGKSLDGFHSGCLRATVSGPETDYKRSVDDYYRQLELQAFAEAKQEADEI